MVAMPRFIPLLVVLFAPLAVGAPVPKAIGKRKKPDLEQLEGRWVVETIDSGQGQQPPKDDWATFYWEVKDGRLFTGTATGPGYRGAGITLDPTQSPKHMDVTSDGTTVPYIYEIDGDTLKTIHSSSGQPRPAGFTGGNGRYSFVWKRAKE
jgi:uncharacterized protein (TIGR03067 family)